jgi:hypothetical protein
MKTGTSEGTQEEIYYTKEINKNRYDFLKYLKIKPEGNFAVRVLKNKYGKINEKKIKPKSDIIICSGDLSEKELKSFNYYIDENMISNLELQPVKKSGISIKLRGSKSYTITKMSHLTFKKVFKNPYIGCGSSIYCKNINEVYKNDSVLNGWRVNKNDFLNYFSDFFKYDSLNWKDLTALKELKTFCNEKIKSIIKEDKIIFDFIFKGVGNFDDPFSCEYLIENDCVHKVDDFNFDFYVTTGSGRSRGIYTIIIKPI